MNGNEIAINGLPFWLVTAAAIALLTIIKVAGARRYVFAALNLIFVGLLIGWKVAAVAGGLLTVYGLLHGLNNSKWRNIATVAIAFTLFLLFILHKSLFLKQQLGGSIIAPLLTAIGFSYVALRGVEILRLVREGRHPAPSLVSLVNYLIPFHMLAAGPIQAYDEFVSQPSVPPPLTTRHVVEGTERISWGLFKKFVLAYVLQKTFLADLQSNGLYFLLEVQIMLIWLYLDFSAYSDIAIGVGRLMGIATPENFDRPFVARNLIEFWDRWHISLSLFIRRNLFIPIQLALMRRSAEYRPLLAATVAIGLSFLIAGLWHGLSIGWFVWGCMHASGLIAVRIYGSLLQSKLTPQQLESYRASSLIRAIGTLLTFEYVAFAFVPVFLLKGTL